MLQDIEKAYGKDAPVIENLNLEIEDGSFTVLLGPSGCGKSTTLRMIAGLEQETGGVLKIDGKDMKEVKPGDRGIAMVFQNYALYPTMTVKENIEFGLKNCKVPKAEREERIKEVSMAVGLEEYLNRKPSALSGGQRQRVALARAMVTEDLALFETLPGYNKYLKGGCMIRSVTSVYPTVTYPCHTTMMTGNYPDRHGVTSNFKLVMNEKPTPWNWFSDVIRSKDIFTACKEKGLTTATVFWPVTGCHKDIDYKIPEYVPQKGDTLEDAFRRAGCDEDMLEIVKKNRVFALLRWMRNEGIYGIGDVFTAEEADEKYHLNGDFSFVIESDDYTSFGESVTKPLVEAFGDTDYRYGRASHGYLPEKGPQPVFMAKGPDFAENVVLEKGRLIDEAPTYAALLGVNLPDTDGEPIKEFLRK